MMLAFDEYLIDTLMRDLVGHDRRPAAFLVYLWLAAAQARAEQAVEVSYQTIAESIGISKSSAQSAVRWLIRRKLITARKTTATATPRYTVLTPWPAAAKTRLLR